MAGDPAFVGRERELVDLLDLIDRALAGRGGLALLGGEPGIGKTALAEQVAGVCAEHGFGAHWGFCWEGEDQPPCWPWTQVLRTVLPTVPEKATAQLGPAFSRLGLLVPELVTPPPPVQAEGGRDDAAAQFALYDVVARTLVLASRSRPLLIVLDDLHASDRSSLRFLAFFVRQLRDARALVLGTHRDVDVDPNSAWASEVGDLARLAHSFSLDGLTITETTTLLESTLPDQPTAALAAEVQLESGGNPLFAAEVARLLAAEGRLTAIPSGIREVVLRRVERFRPETRQVLEAAAAMGTPVEISELAAVCEQTPESLLDLLALPLAARILRWDAASTQQLWFSHALVRQAILDQLSPRGRATLHRRAAQVLEVVGLRDPGPYLTRLAGHYVEAAVLGDHEPAIRYSAAAAAQAKRAYAFEEAARHLGTALQMLEHEPGTPPDKLCELQLDLADAQWRSGAARTAVAGYRLALELADNAESPQLVARAALGCCVDAAPYAERPDLVVLLQDALRLLPDEELTLRSAVLGRLAEILIVFEAHAETARTAAETAVETARRSRDDAALSRALRSVIQVQWAPDTLQSREEIAAELLAVAERRDDGDLQMQALLIAFGCRLESGDRDGADELLGELVRLAALLRSPQWTSRALCAEAAMAALDGRYADALPLVTEATALVERLQVPAWWGAAVLAARVQLGFDVLLDDAVATAEQFRRLGASYGHALWYGTAAACAIAGRVVETRQALTSGLEVLRSYPNRLSMLPGAFRLAQAALRIEQTEPLPYLYEVLRPYDDRVAALGEGVAVLGPVALALGELAIAIGDREAAEDHLRLSHEVAGRMGSRPWTARTLLGEARLLRASIGEQAARRPLAQARKIAEELDMTRLLADIDAQSDTRPRERAGAPISAVLRRDGDYWSVACGDATARLRDSKGLRYLADVIAHPGVERHVFDLVTLTEGGAEAEVSRHQLGDAGPLLDAQAKAAYKRRLAQLREELEDATAFGDDNAAAEARAEIDALVAELARAVGLGGRDRRAASAAEKARLNVTRALRSAITRIGEAHPLLGAHLHRTVRTGTFCCYQPGPQADVRWQPPG